VTPPPSCAHAPAGAPPTFSLGSFFLVPFDETCSTCHVQHCSVQIDAYYYYCLDLSIRRAAACSAGSRGSSRRAPPASRMRVLRRCAAVRCGWWLVAGGCTSRLAKRPARDRNQLVTAAMATSPARNRPAASPRKSPGGLKSRAGATTPKRSLGKHSKKSKQPAAGTSGRLRLSGRAAAPSPAKRELFASAAAGTLQQDAQGRPRVGVGGLPQLEVAEDYALQLPDGSGWSTTVWEEAVVRMQTLLTNADQMATSLGTSRRGQAAKPLAAMRDILAEVEGGGHSRGRGKKTGGGTPTTRTGMCALFRESVAALSKQHSSTLAGSCPAAVVHTVLGEAYAAAVTNPRALNKYKPFSHEVYGETNANLVAHIIESQRVTAEDTFFDLGSGIGQVVLQVAAATGCRALGIELMDNPAECAHAMLPAFEASLQKWGRALARPPSLIHGNFLECDELKEATVIFINNFAFPVALSQQLGAHIAAICKPGTRVLSYKDMIPTGRRRNSRPREDGALHEVGREKSPDDGVSWMTGPVECISYVVP
jgi:hypothetical protein